MVARRCGPGGAGGREVGGRGSGGAGRALRLGRRCRRRHCQPPVVPPPLGQQLGTFKHLLAPSSRPQSVPIPRGALQVRQAMRPLLTGPPPAGHRAAEALRFACNAHKMQAWCCKPDRCCMASEFMQPKAEKQPIAADLDRIVRAQGAPGKRADRLRGCWFASRPRPFSRCGSRGGPAPLGPVRQHCTGQPAGLPAAVQPAAAIDGRPPHACRPLGGLSC